MTASTNSKITLLTWARDSARDRFFALSRPHNAVPAEVLAFQVREVAHRLLLKAAQIELDAELELQHLLSLEQSA